MTAKSPLAAVLLRQQLRNEAFARGKVYADMPNKLAWDMTCCVVFRWWLI